MCCLYRTVHRARKNDWCIRRASNANEADSCLTRSEPAMDGQPHSAHNFDNSSILQSSNRPPKAKKQRQTTMYPSTALIALLIGSTGVHGAMETQHNDSNTRNLRARRNAAGDDLSTDASGIAIDPKVMDRFAGEGFKYIGFTANDAHGAGIGSVHEDEDSIHGGSRRQLQDSVTIMHDIDDYSDDSSVLVTVDGDVYIAYAQSGESEGNRDTTADDVLSEDGSEVTPPKPQFGASHTNMKSVLGADTRSRVPANPGWQFWRIVYVNGCSGTIVGKNKVLTNAHCVYTRGGSWRVPSTVSPGANPSDPWGTWNVSHARISRMYVDGGNRSGDYDYAILTIKNDNWTGQDIGDYMGHFPITAASCSSLGSTRTKKRIVGYPGDKPGKTMWTSGRCDNWSYQCNARRVYHRCDTYPGNSGSGILMYYNSGIKVVGVHAFGTTSSGGWNSGPAFTPEVAQMLRGW